MSDLSAPQSPPVPPTGQAPAPPSGARPLPLRPMGIAELVDGAIKLYRRKWAALMAMVAIIYIPLIFIQFALTQDLVAPFESALDPLATPEQQLGALQTALGPLFVIGGAFGLFTILFVQPFLTAAMARAASRLYLGEEVTIGDTYRYAIGRVLSILWISILTALALLLVVVVVAVLTVVLIAGAGGGAAGDVSGLLLVVLLIGGFIAAIYVAIRLAFGSTVLVIEGLRGTKALGRSWRLVKGKFWRVLGVFVVAGLVSFIVALVISTPLEAVFSAIGPEAWPLAALSEALATVVVVPFSTLITVLLYFDLRIRKEGFDLEVMAQELSTPT